MFSLSVSGQEEHFSDYTNAPLVLNSAYTGFIPGEHNLRVSTILRDQWSSSLEGNAFRTVAAAVDGRICGTEPGDYFGLGARILADWQGEPTIKTTAAYLSGAYTKSLGGRGNKPTMLLGLGAEIGVIGYSLELADLTFDDQFDDPNIPDEVFSRSAPLVLDYGVGGHFYYDDKNSSLRQWRVAVAVKHLSEPERGFLQNELTSLTSSDSSSVLKQRYNVQGGTTLMLRGRKSLTFQGVYSWQRPHNELRVQVEFNFIKRGQLDPDNKFFTVGAGYRLNDGVNGLSSESVVLLTRFYHENFVASLTADVNVSKYSSITRGLGGLELGVSYFFGTGGGGCFYCPRI